MLVATKAVALPDASVVLLEPHDVKESIASRLEGLCSALLRAGDVDDLRRLLIEIRPDLLVAHQCGGTTDLMELVERVRDDPLTSDLVILVVVDDGDSRLPSLADAALGPPWSGDELSAMARLLLRIARDEDTVRRAGRAWREPL